jgi:transcriptional regulator with XRE-family HTH domain
VSTPSRTSSSATLVARVAQRIAARRRERGLSQEGLAALLDIAVKNVQRIESGKQNLTLATLERIAEALEIAPERLLAGPASRTAREPNALDRLREAGFTVRRATERGRRSARSVPVMTLRAAAGRLDGTAKAIETMGWVEIPQRSTPAEGHFVAEVRGASMSPKVPAGALCLFGPPHPPPLGSRVLLVAHETLHDGDLGGPYALKRVRQRRGRVVLESINPAFPPIEIDSEEGELRIVAELVRVLLVSSSS